MAGPAYVIAQINIAMNEDWIVPFVYSALSVDGTTTSPIDLTGSTFNMDFRYQESDAEVLLALSTENGAITITDPVNGEFQIWITQQQAYEQLEPGDFVCDLIRTMPDGTSERIMDCTVTVVEGTTR